MADAPPRSTRLRYYVLGITPPARYRAWVERDIESRGWLLRRAAIALAVTLGWILIWGRILGASAALWPVLLGAAIALPLVLRLGADFARRQSLHAHERRWNREMLRGRGGITGPASTD